MEKAIERCELSIEEHDGSCNELGHDKAIAARAAARVVPSWSKLVRRAEGAGSFRDYLDGDPIHCGDVLELQSFEYKSDDYGEYTVKLAKGTRVRYELSNGRVVLCTSVGGHEFASAAAEWMCFRWPPGSRAFSM